MAATLSSSGTWSTLASSPTQQVDTTSDNFGDSELGYRRQIAANLDGYPEAMQFLGLAAANWAVPPGAALFRILAIFNSMRQTEQPEPRR